MSEEARPTGWEGAERWFASSPGSDAGDGGGEGSPGGEEPGEPPVRRCEVCGAELEADQTYCLECGSPTPLAPRLRRGGRAVGVLAGAMVVLGLGAGALAYAVVSEDDEAREATATAPTALPPPDTSPGTPLPPATGPPSTTGPLPPDTTFTTPTAPTSPTAPGTTGFDTVTGPPSTPTTEEPPPATTEDEPDTGASDWPPGRTAWTAILSSVRDESDARAAKARVRDAGEPAGVLFSSDFADLRPGYWVVYSGLFDDRGAAIAQAASLRPQFPGAYARRLQG